MRKLLLTVIVAFTFTADCPAQIVSAANDECEDFRDRGRRNRESGFWIYALDTLKLYVERCAGEPQAASEIISLIGVVQSLAGQTQDVTVFRDHREWLKSVMYLNLDQQYYCAVASGILGTFADYSDFNGAIAVLDYLIESGKCPDLVKHYWEDRVRTRELQIERYLDTVRDQSATPIDTTKKTLEDLDLQILRGQSAVAEHDIKSGLNWLAVPNPFLDQVTVRLDAPHAGFVRIELFDLLGQRQGESIERQIEKGATSFTYPTSDLPRGTYLLRVEFDGWQVSTQKIEKE